MTEKTVLITGASSGIGKETAKTLLAQGYTVYAAARRVEKMDDLKDLGAIPIRMDITKEEEIAASVGTDGDGRGGLDIVDEVLVGGRIVGTVDVVDGEPGRVCAVGPAIVDVILVLAAGIPKAGHDFPLVNPMVRDHQYVRSVRTAKRLVNSILVHRRHLLSCPSPRGWEVMETFP